MRTSILNHQIKVNWWLWFGLSIPVGIYLLLQPQDRGAELVSDWDYLKDWVRNYILNREFWAEVGLAMARSFGTAIVIGWIAQSFMMIIRQLIRQNHITKT